MRKFVRYPILAATHNDTVERSRRYVEDKIEKYTKEYDDCVDDGDFFSDIQLMRSHINSVNPE